MWDVAEASGRKKPKRQQRQTPAEVDAAIDQVLKGFAAKATPANKGAKANVG